MKRGREIDNENEIGEDEPPKKKQKVDKFEGFDSLLHELINNMDTKFWQNGTPDIILEHVGKLGDELDPESVRSQIERIAPEMKNNVLSLHTLVKTLLVKQVPNITEPRRFGLFLNLAVDFIQYLIRVRNVDIVSEFKYPDQGFRFVMLARDKIRSWMEGDVTETSCHTQIPFLSSCERFLEIMRIDPADPTFRKIRYHLITQYINNSQHKNALVILETRFCQPFSHGPEYASLDERIGLFQQLLTCYNHLSSETAVVDEDVFDDENNGDKKRRKSRNKRRRRRLRWVDNNVEEEVEEEEEEEEKEEEDDEVEMLDSSPLTTTSRPMSIFSSLTSGSFLKSGKAAQYEHKIIRTVNTLVFLYDRKHQMNMTKLFNLENDKDDPQPIVERDMDTYVLILRFLTEYEDRYPNSVAIKRLLFKYQKDEDSLKTLESLISMYERGGYLDSALEHIDHYLRICGRLETSSNSDLVTQLQQERVFEIHEKKKEVFFKQKRMTEFCEKAIENVSFLPSNRNNDQHKIEYLMKQVERDTSGNISLRKTLIQLLIREKDEKNYLKLIEMDARSNLNTRRGMGRDGASASTSNDSASVVVPPPPPPPPNPISNSVTELSFRMMLKLSNECEKRKKDYQDLETNLNTLTEKVDHFFQLNDISKHSLFEDRQGYVTIPVTPAVSALRHGDFLNSEPVLISGVRWYLRLYPKGVEKEGSGGKSSKSKSSSTQNCGLFLHLEESDHRRVTAYYSVSLVTLNEERTSLKNVPACSTNFVQKEFSRSCGGWGVRSLCPVSVLNKNAFVEKNRTIWKFKIRIRTLDISST